MIITGVIEHRFNKMYISNTTHKCSVILMNIISSVVVALEMFLPNFTYEFLYFSSLSFYSQLKMYARARNLSKIGKNIQSGV